MANLNSNECFCEVTEITDDRLPWFANVGGCCFAVCELHDAYHYVGNRVYAATEPGPPANWQEIASRLHGKIALKVKDAINLADAEMRCGAKPVGIAKTAQTIDGLMGEADYAAEQLSELRKEIYDPGAQGDYEEGGKALTNFLLDELRGALHSIKKNLGDLAGETVRSMAQRNDR